VGMVDELVHSDCYAPADSARRIRSSIPLLSDFVDSMLFVSLAAYHGSVA